MNSDVSDFKPEVFKLLPEVVKALEGTSKATQCPELHVWL